MNISTDELCGVNNPMLEVCTSNPNKTFLTVHIFLPPVKNFSGRYCFALRLVFFLFFFMFAGTLSLEWLDGSQPNCHTI